MKTFIDCTQDTPLKAKLTRLKSLYNEFYEEGYITAADKLESVIQDLESELDFLRDEYIHVIGIDFENISTGRHP